LPLLFFSAGGYAQNPLPSKKITGKVIVAPDDKPLEGASVTVRGRAGGTQTDKDGLFALEAKNGDVLIISYVGYLRKEIRVGARQSVNIRLELEDKSKLNDVVVIGYGKARRPDLTGAIS